MRTAEVLWLTHERAAKKPPDSSSVFNVPGVDIYSTNMPEYMYNFLLAHATFKGPSFRIFVLTTFENMVILKILE